MIHCFWFSWIRFIFGDPMIIFIWHSSNVLDWVIWYLMNHSIHLDVDYCWSILVRKKNRYMKRTKKDHLNHIVTLLFHFYTNFQNFVIFFHAPLIFCQCLADVLIQDSECLYGFYLIHLCLFLSFRIKKKQNLIKIMIH